MKNRKRRTLIGLGALFVYLLLTIGVADKREETNREKLEQTKVKALELWADQEEIAGLVKQNEDVGYDLVPPKVGKFEEMWSGLRDSDRWLYVPVFGLYESLDKAVKEKGVGNVKITDAKGSWLYMRAKISGKESNLPVVYTEPKLLKAGTVVQKVRPLGFLKAVLEDERSEGIFFNPKTRVCDELVFNRAMNVYGVPELIGYLEATPDDSGRPYHELALDAETRGAHYEVLYYWAMSYREPRPGDDWKKAELAKVRAYKALGYQWSKERAVGELKWFIGAHGRTPERLRALSELMS